jgi:hypothetical protein
MEVHSLASVAGGMLELDLCFACHGIWFDPLENLKLTPGAVVELFRLLHAHRDDVRQPLASSMACPRCNHALAKGFDQVRSGRYITYRCPQRHGRFSAFSSFMIEKGFVRQLTQFEIDDMAQRVAVISCSACGAPVDLRKDHACPHCRSAFSLLDPQAVEHALQGYAKATSGTGELKIPQLADALVMLERDRLRAQREAKERGTLLFPGDTSPRVDLWGLGVAMVGRLLD